MKSNIIQNVQHLASKLFNKEVARMHYATDRLTGFTLNQILDLEARFKKEVLIKNQIKYKSK
tara:strand:+ start:6874 stop:7059 length:186 start_codon:yes stop_codon:yes gene_type:complete